MLQNVFSNSTALLSNMMANPNLKKNIKQYKEYFENTPTYKRYIKDNKLILYIIISIIVVYLLTSFLSFFFRLPIIIFVGVLLGIFIQQRVNQK